MENLREKKKADKIFVWKPIGKFKLGKLIVNGSVISKIDFQLIVRKL
jgi:hypothetical protein